MRRALLVALVAVAVQTVAVQTSFAVPGDVAGAAPANQRPVVQSDYYSVAAGEVLDVPAPGVLANDADPDGDPLTIYPDLLPGGPIDLRPDGSFTFTPPPGFTGDYYSFDYYAFDGQIVNTCCAHVYLSIYSAAVAVDDNYVALNTAPRTVPAPGVLANDTGVAVRLQRPPAHGEVVLRRTGGFTYTAQPGYVGTDVFTYRVYSGLGTTLSPPARVTLQVKANNAAPIAEADTFSTREDEPLSEPAPGVMANDRDPDGDPLTVELVSYPVGEYFDLHPDGSFYYEPPPDYDSRVTFRYRVTDGLATSAITTATIDIRFVNDAPTANNDDFFLTARAVDVPAPGVLGNDEGDVEGDSFIAVLDTQPQFGRVQLNPDGSFSYRHVGPLQRPDTFTYHLLDSQGAVSNTATAILSG